MEWSMKRMRQLQRLIEFVKQLAHAILMRLNLAERL
jgi:hypothetical protein